MEKLKILFLLVATIAIGVTAQLQVAGNGQIQVGNIDSSNSSSKAVIINQGLDPVANPDTTAAIYVAGPNAIQSGGKIAFGKRGDVSVTVEGNTLNAGMYIYALIADGVEVDSKG